MDDRHYNPLMLHHWSQTLEALIEWLALNDTLSDAIVMRRFLDVVRHAPHPDLTDGLYLHDPFTVDQLLAVGAADTLALSLVGPDNGFFASRGGTGEYLVSVVIEGRGEETTAAGMTLTRAIVNALALSLSQPPCLDHGADLGGDHGYGGFHAMAVAGATLH